MLGTILWAIIAGTILGVLARLILPGRQNISVWVTILVGIGAALIGGLIADWLGVGDTEGKRDELRITHVGGELAI